MLAPDKAKQAVGEYVTALTGTFLSGQATEHTYRPAFKEFIRALDPSVVSHNEPKRSEHGAPDFIFVRGELIVGYAETKDIGIDLDKVENSEQLSRYFGYSNLILTDYLEFRFFKNGARACEPISIGTVQDGTLVAHPEQYAALATVLADFVQGVPEPITSGKRLAEIMGGKARRIRDNVAVYLTQESDKNADLMRIFETVKKLLVHDLTSEKFADMYAQTLVYGLFIARYNDKTSENFTRQEARDLVPASNPFLREFFDHIVGPRFDIRLRFIVDELCAVFSVSDVREITHRHLKVGSQAQDEKDPIIHFYEDFLKEYDPDERKKMGAYYTPIPVARFIVRAVDEALKCDFGLAKGLADTAKRTVTVTTQGMKPRKVDVHRVQVLDPAVGTATFLNEVVNHVYKSFAGQEGRWPSYVETDLLPRLYGFELMMAPYTIAHLKLGMTLRETGCADIKQRLGVYLTNTLEEGVRRDDTLFGFGLSQVIAEEADKAAKIKKEHPIMVVIGNPPYSVSSSNKGEWIQNLIKVYKEGLGEKKINLDDDYIKFIRFSEYLIEKNGSGIVAMITNNSYIDGITHRQMRKHLLETFDDIYVLDLHGSTKKKETAPDGGKDENVFNIQQGVAIVLLVKRESTGKKRLGNVHFSELFGSKKSKFAALDKSEAEKIDWKKLDYKEPYYFFVPKDFTSHGEYEQGLNIAELFTISNSGVKTDRDNLFIDHDRKALEDRIETLLSGQYSDDFKDEFRVVDSGSYKITQKIREKVFKGEMLKHVQYRPFDSQWIYYDPTLISRPAEKVSQHMLGDNLLLVFTRLNRQLSTNYFFVTDSLADIHLLDSASDSLSTAPLYLYHPDGTRTANFDRDTLKVFTKNLHEPYEPENVLDYIYAVLHSPKYRETYKEFLKIDFPRVPAPADDTQFHRLAALGKQLRELHLLTSSAVNAFVTTYPKDGSNVMEKLERKGDDVWINKEQYFGNVPDVAWNFYIGGYQPAQKWLKDRKGRILTNEDIEHYQKMIVALAETSKIMKEIDGIFMT